MTITYKKSKTCGACSESETITATEIFPQEYNLADFLYCVRKQVNNNSIQNNVSDKHKD